jgi:Raf kinase inhibitor-like YbhB/YbcL family protein
MSPSRALATSIGFVLLSLTTPLRAQDRPTDVTIEAHIYEPQRLPPTDARIAGLQRPQGFSIQRFAEGLDNPRMLAVAEDGTIYVTQRQPGNLVMLRDVDGDGVVDVQKIVARIRHLHGIEIRGREIYLVDIHRIYVAALMPDGSLGRLRTIVRNLPDAGQHPNRTLEFSPQGELFVSIGSTCNECREPNPNHATLQRIDQYERHGAKREIIASGLRNVLGYGWHPSSGRLYAFDNGVDMLGDNEQSEELNEVESGKRYGWPYVYDHDQINPHTEPVKLTSEQWAELSEEPVGLYTPHSAPMQMIFYSGSQFPIEYRENAFVPMRGSWNRKPPSGYEVLRIRFSAGGDFEVFEPFVTGFLESLPEGQFGFFGRPVGVATAIDGSLIFSDDTNNMLYRVAATASSGTPAPQVLAQEIFDVPATLQVSSPAIPEGGMIPKKYSDYGKGISPPLRWASAPQGTQSFVLMMEDPDAVSPLPFVHWTIVNIPAGHTSLPQGVRKAFQPVRGAPLRQGSNSKTEVGYFGPRPPPGDPAHAYHFQLFALDTQLNLPDGFNRNALLKAMEGHVLAKGDFIARFAQPE